ncbi:MAG: tetratricopeptide repeat protein [Mesorhizobium sp.]|nr:MAG: tetratricopeptide repeat protein [Mesorhizobium sp.]RWL95363.1 MAG: tetratricopeptide repeat protein [Mesorhizobium sp.]
MEGQGRQRPRHRRLLQAIDLDPKLAKAFAFRGSAWKDKGDNDRAVANYNRAIELDPKYAAAYYGRGNAWGANGDNDRALTDYNQALHLDPKYANAYLSRGITFFFGGHIPIEAAGPYLGRCSGLVAKDDELVMRVAGPPHREILSRQSQQSKVS